MSEFRFIGSRLDEKMAEMGLTDTTLAEKTGISKTTIYYLRKGREGRQITTSAENLQLLADALRTSPEWFVNERAESSPNQKKMSALVADIAGIAEELPLSRQRELRALGAALVKLEQSTDVGALYSDLMDKLMRLTELKGGKTALKELAAHIESLTAGSPSVPVTRRTGRGPTTFDDTKAAKKPTQGGEQS